MVPRLIKRWTRHREDDRRQLPLFPDWERAEWLRPLPALGAALGLALLFAVWTPPDAPAPIVASLTEPVADTESDELSTLAKRAAEAHAAAGDAADRKSVV